MVPVLAFTLAIPARLSLRSISRLSSLVVPVEVIFLVIGVVIHSDHHLRGGSKRGGERQDYHLLIHGRDFTVDEVAEPQQQDKSYHGSKRVHHEYSPDLEPPVLFDTCLMPLNLQFVQDEIDQYERHGDEQEVAHPPLWAAMSSIS